ncbi:MAG TPA: TlpA disulfide reductase family protein [Sediminibacterium sp.]|uniref:TlpA disulfide reductase family protein n=1 Tax=Sediminibacterium sp. TaxID=1917865 RepID=UPI0008D67F0B|nr:TlpA disulfide reductase family protein [Sediminibacterium sp.]OHC85911.1 MAG: hypothetical protein A2472_09300 [Sphingobacteriia bacterium RIFOXYC2_FULL_35_18]OHC87446.1 MAG: hypothetical protein A2546_05455 [Sphingobacteriia bacterium RIFOXYD2_FULL_35_12]HLD52420.1 TlpA disulfide reductase family protein [Sediminibacterium sp.]
MRTLLLIIAFQFLIIDGFTQQNKFVLKGTITDTLYHLGKVVLIYKDSTDRFKFDTAITTNGKFSFKGELPIVSRMQLTVHAEPNLSLSKRNKQIEIYFAIENCDAEVTISKFNDYTIRGSNCYNDLLSFNNALNPLFKKHKGSELIQRQNALVDSFIMAKPSSYVSLLLMYERISNATYLGELNQWFNKLPENFQKASIGLNMQKKLKKLKEIAPGQLAPNFTMPDLHGNMVSLYDYKGKYVFIHFWGSWCSPCRQENVNLVNANLSKNNENLIFIGVSVDESKTDLENAILKDKITWTQLTSFKGFTQTAMLEFGVKGVPRNFLIDPNGKIIAMDLRGSELLEKLIGLVQ